MPAFLHFYPGLDPQKFRALTLAEFNAMAEYLAASLGQV